MVFYLGSIRSTTRSESTSDTMYNGSTFNSGGQVANGQSVCRPAPGPTMNWLETPSKHRHQLQQKENGEPVAVRVMTNSTGAPSERSDNYVRPYGNNQPEPTCPAYLDFLYDRVQQPVQSPSSSPGMAMRPNGFAGVTSPHSDEYRSLSRAVPAPVHQRLQETSTAAETLAGASSEYNPFSRATPAPIQQHAATSAQRPATISSAGADAGTPTSPRATQHGNSEPHTAEVS